MAPSLTPSLEERLLVLLERSLIAWRVLGRVSRDASGAITLDSLGGQIQIVRAEPHLPFRWMVRVDGRARPAVSLVAVLRQARHALDPGYERARVRIAAMRLPRCESAPD